MKIKDLRANPKNPRKVTTEKLAMLKKSIAEFGDLSGVVFNRKTNQLVGGHQRVKILDEDSVITITKKFLKPTKSGTVAEGYVTLHGEKFSYREVHWDETREKAANLAANKGAGEWDLPQLGEWLKELNSFDLDFDTDLTMFDASELKEHLEVRRVGKTGVDEDEIPEVKDATTKLGDLYILDEHRLLCGDSTSGVYVERLMKGEKADICFTSPPYNLGDNAKLRGYNGDGDDSAYRTKSDHMSQKNYLDFLKAWTVNALEASQLLFCNIQILAGNKLVIPEYWNSLRNHLVDIMIWDKEHAQPSAAARVLNSVWEFIFIFSKEENPKRSIKTGPTFRGDVDNVFRLNPVGKKDALAKDHGAVFPVAFAEHIVSKFSTHSVLDLFGGSGSTLIACEKIKRKCFMMEIDPHYCDIIVQRWENYTGRKAKLISNPKQKTPALHAKHTQKLHA